MSPCAPHQVGDRLPIFERTLDFEQLNRFAAVNDEFEPLHMDDAAGQAAGFVRALAMGNLIWSLVHVAAREWFPGGRIAQASIEFRAPALRGERCQIRGAVVGRVARSEGWTVDLSIQVTDGEGRVLSPGRLTVDLA